MNLLILILSSFFVKTQAQSVDGRYDWLRKQTPSAANGLVAATIEGWACQRGLRQSLDVVLYSNSRKIKTVLANQSSEAAISRACGVSGGSYRYKIPLTVNELQQYHGEPFKVLPVLNNGSLGNPLKKTFNDQPSMLPSPPTVSSLVGYWDSFVPNLGEGIGSVTGWACMRGSTASVVVELWVDGREYVRQVPANKPSESAVANACGVSGGSFRFEIPITDSDTKRFGGRGIVVLAKTTPNAGLRSSALRKSHIPSIRTIPKNMDSSSLRSDDVIEAGTKVTITGDLDVGVLTIRGSLLCSNDANNMYTIRAKAIIVDGPNALFECGTSADNPGNLRIILYGNQSVGAHGPKAMVATNGGTIRMHGAQGKEGYQKLEGTVYPGSNKINVRQKKSMEVGDKLVVGPTDFDPRQSEERAISAIEEVNGMTAITLNKALNFKHWGETEVFRNGKGMEWTLDERAEVFVLDRSIVIESEDDSFVNTSRPLGGTMIIRDGGKGYIDNVEFHRMGQAGIMGRYPFHWHLLRDSGASQYVRNSSIHNSFNRCIVVHQTSSVTVQGNTCFDHFGHGIFLEDGNEIKNRIVDNLVVQTKVPTGGNALLSSDIGGKNKRFMKASSFWIAHPDNYVKGNIASGSEGTGFWMSFVRSTESFVQPQARPLSSNTWVFDDNVAHSMSIGITHDGRAEGGHTGNANNPNDRSLVNAHYSPPVAPTLKNLSVFKCSQAGVYYRGDRLIYKNVVAADNAASFFMAYDQEVVDSVVVGQSRNGSPMSEINGIYIYDGPSWIQNVHFAEFRGTNVFAFDQVVAWERFTNQWMGLSFQNVDKRIRAIAYGSEKNIFPTHWSDMMFSANRDIDGSLTGIPGALAVPDHPWNRDSRCRGGNQYEEDTIVCRYDVSYLNFNKNSPTLDFRVERRHKSSGEVVKMQRVPRGPNWNKFSMIQGSRYIYATDNLIARRMYFWTQDVGDISPIVHLRGFGRCSVSSTGIGSVPEVRSLNVLEGVSDTRIFRNGNDMYIRFRTNLVKNSTIRRDTFRAFSEYSFGC